MKVSRLDQWTIPFAITLLILWVIKSVSDGVFFWWRLNLVRKSAGLDALPHYPFEDIGESLMNFELWYVFVGFSILHVLCILWKMSKNKWSRLGMLIAVGIAYAIQYNFIYFFMGKSFMDVVLSLLFCALTLLIVYFAVYPVTKWVTTLLIEKSNTSEDWRNRYAQKRF